jgi:hypothetical protein
MDDLDPATAASLDDLAACLRHVHLLADKPTYRALEQQSARAGGFLPGTRLKRARLTRSTVSDVLTGRKFPGKAFLLTFIDACGVDLENDRRWEQAWDRLAVQYDRQPAEAAFEQLRRQLEQLRGQLAGAEHRAGEAQADAERLRAELQVQAGEHRAALERAQAEAAGASKAAYGQLDGPHAQLAATGEKIPVTVEWALEGKTLGRRDYRVLACSDGDLSGENFTELLGRFSLGMPAELPQVSVSYLTSGPPPHRTYYQGMALHKWAADIRTEGGELPERDDAGRPVAVTAYFCVPYQRLAEAAVSYQAMYQAFDNLRLGTTDGPPLQVEFPVRIGLPAVDDLAMQSAARLLTGRPVCVLGAESATVAERLDFIDAVATLLPYGFRTRLTAATWVRPTHRNHRFRLFFTAAKRDADPPDHVVYWGSPEATELTADDNYACMYDSWLAETVGQLGVLARLTTPRSFSHEEVSESLNEIGVPAPTWPPAAKPESQGRRPHKLPPAAADPPDHRYPVVTVPDELPAQQVSQSAPPTPG